MLFRNWQNPLPSDGPVEVNGLNLPEPLLTLMRAGGWKRPRNTQPIADLTGIKDPARLEFLTLRRMIAETNSVMNLYSEGHAATYGLTYTGRENEQGRVLDVNRMVVLAVNDDEEGICLDYRTNPAEPSVIAGIWQGQGANEHVEWKTAAADFVTFAARIGLT